MKVIGYARVVPDPKALEALAHQRARLEGFCRDNGWELLCVFEEAVNGDFPLSRREQLQKAVAMLSKDTALLVVRLEKLSSNRPVLKELIAACKQKGADVKVVQGPQTAEEMTSSLQVTSEIL